jgi:hypothetical protein
MSGDVHVRFCESLGVKFPRATQPQEALKLVSAEPLPLDDAMLVVSD